MMTREKQITRLRENNPSMTVTEIARLVGTTRQRVWYVLHTAGLPTAVIVELRDLTLTCDECGESFKRRACEERIGKARNPNKMVFCSKRCHGRWLGRTAGFGVNSQNYRQKQTHCLRGHPLEEGNLYYDKRGNRCCWECMRVRSRERNLRRKGRN